MKILYFDCFSGAAGDMILGALLDAGSREEAVRSELARLPLTGFELETERVNKKGINALKVHVRVREKDQPHRHFHDIKNMLLASGLSPRVREVSLAVFTRLAAAEGKVHGVPPEKVHFHEVGAVDSIVDIVGTAAALADLGAEKIYSSPLQTGCGTVECAHGVLPVPAPATLELLRGVPVSAPCAEGELLTPTGAAILTTIATFGPPPAMTVLKTGYGAGSRELARPNVLRVTVGKARAAGLAAATVTVYEATIDDMNPEFYGYLAGKLADAGAVDVTLTPVLMKKGRPGTMVTVLVHSPHEEAVLQALFAETTTLGVRRTTADKLMLNRRSVEVKTPYGLVRIKLGELDGRLLNASPEYEDCAALAAGTGTPLKEIYAAALAAWQQKKKQERFPAED
ncbi:MAG TPA: nickel pincer cofactor biosynthesis protein LarC [Firmicutes bacterium]|nr:nickel pincer cofactor biosynthesis protein LarC [Bacillota bacterium]